MKRIYDLMPFYLVRSAVSECGFGEENNTLEELCNEFWNNGIFREQLLIASPSLYRMIMSTPISNMSNKTKQQLKNSLLSYQNRAAYRTTPFGLFSGCEIKNVGNRDNSFERACVKKHCRVDIEWLYSLVKNVEEKCYKSFSYKINNSIYTLGDRVYLPFDYENNNGQISILRTKPFAIIEKMCKKDYVNFWDIFGELKRVYPEREDIVLEQFIFQLIKKSYILSELRVPLCNTDELGSLIEKLEKYPELSEKKKCLEEIRNDIRIYEKTELGNGYEILENIYVKMKRIYDHKKSDLLQIDCEWENFPILLQNKDVNVICDFITYINELQKADNKRVLRDYEVKFLEKYGSYIEVPIYELLDESLGIGAPSDYKNPANKYTKPLIEEKDNFWLKEYFLEKYAYAVKNNSCIQLFDEKTHGILTEGDDTQYIASLELNFMLKTENNKYKFILGPNVGSISAGKTFGRFGYFSENYAEHIKNIKDVSIDEEVECELSFVPYNIRVGNVIRNVTGAEYNLCCYTSSYDVSKEICLQDIVVGYDSGHLYLKDSRLGRRIKVKLTNMLNYKLLPNIYRLLLDISDSKYNILSKFVWENYYADFTYIPEIRYKDIIISNEKWRFTHYSLNIAKKASYEEFKVGFNILINDLKIPNKVYFTVADNRLLLDLKQEKYIELLFSYYKKNSSMELEKVETGEYLSIEGKKHCIEVVLPFLRNNIKNSLDEEQTQISTVKNNKNYYLPFNQWLFLKLYGPMERQDELIEFLYFWIRFHQIEEEFFFMRYLDPQPHIRLRIKGESSELYKIIMEFNELISELKDKKLIGSYCIDTYVPETERYGGVNVMSYAEKLFYMDSCVVMGILSEFDIGKNKEKYGVISILQYLKAFGLSFEEQYKFLERHIDLKKYLEDFKKVKQEFVTECDAYNNWTNLKGNKILQKFLVSLEGRTNTVKMYAKQILLEKNLENTYEDIVGSVIHLHCNRLFGINREFEQKIMNYAYRTLHGQKYFRRQMLNNEDNKEY